MLINSSLPTLSQLISKKFLCRSLLVSTAWLLCDMSINKAIGETASKAAAKKESKKSDEKLVDSEKDIKKEEFSITEKEKSESDSVKDTKKDEPSITDQTKSEADPFKPVFSKDEFNVLNMPDSSIDDFDKITKKIFTRLDQGYTDTIDGAMTSAYETNPDIKQQRAALRATDEGVVQAKAGWRPTITGTLSAGLTNNKVNPDDRRDETIDNLNSHNKSRTQLATVEARQNLFQGGNTVYSTRAATSAVKSGRAQLEDQVQKTLLESITAFLNLLAKYAELQYNLDNEEIQKKGLEQNMAKAEVGDETRTTVAQSEFEYTEAVGKRIRSEGELEALKADYEKVVNKKPGNLAVPEIPTIPDNLEAVLEKVRLNNPQILKAQFDELTARHNVDINQSALLPEVNLTASSLAQLNRNKDTQRIQGPGERGKYFNDKTVNNSIKVEMKVPLYEAGTNRSKTRQAAETASEQRIKIEAVRRDVLDRAARSWSAFVAARENRIIYKNQMKAAQASVEGVRQEVEVGAKAYIDLINETRRLVQAQQNYVESEKIYLLSAYEVLYWMGVLTPRSQNLHVDIYDPKLHYNDVKNKF